VPGLSAPLPAPGAVGEAIRRLGRRDSPLRIEPRLDPALLLWLLRFWRSAEESRHVAGRSAMLRLGLRSFGVLDEMRSRGVSFELHADGLLFAALAERELRHYLEVFEALEREGYPGGHALVPMSEIAAFEPALGPGVAAALFAPAERHVRPETLTAGLVRHLREGGTEILESAEVLSLRSEGRRVRSFHAADGEREVDAVVVAAGLWTRDLLRKAGFRLPLLAGKGYSVTIGSAERPPRRPLYLVGTRMGVTPYDGAVRLAGMFELMRGDLSVDPRRLEALRRSAQPFLAEPELADRAGDEWSGLRPFLPDGLPAIGRVPGFENLYVASGHGLLGITLAPATGDVLAPLVLEGEPSPTLAPFAPGRFRRTTRGARPPAPL
jgi:D-amino-acid dehydrogenase